MSVDSFSVNPFVGLAAPATVLSVVLNPLE